MIKWRFFCRILKRLNAINVSSEYCVKRVNFLFCLRFINYKDVLFKNYDLRSSDVKKTQFWCLNSISYVLMVSMMFMCFSNDKMVQWQSLGYSLLVWCSLSACNQNSFLLYYALFCLANVNINTLPAYFYGIWKVSFSAIQVAWFDAIFDCITNMIGRLLNLHIVKPTPNNQTWKRRGFLIFILTLTSHFTFSYVFIL